MPILEWTILIDMAYNNYHKRNGTFYNAPLTWIPYYMNFVLQLPIRREGTSYIDWTERLIINLEELPDAQNCIFYSFNVLGWYPVYPISRSFCWS